MTGISLRLFHLDAEIYTHPFRVSLSVSDTVPITREQSQHRVGLGSSHLHEQPRDPQNYHNTGEL